MAYKPSANKTSSDGLGLHHPYRCLLQFLNAKLLRDVVFGADEEVSGGEAVRLPGNELQFIHVRLSVL